MPLEKMPVEKKIQAMESLWDDLCNRAGDSLSPSLHGDELEKREAAVARGEETLEDWNSARENIKKATR